MSCMEMKTWITNKADLAHFVMKGYEREFVSGRPFRRFFGVNSYGMLRIHSVDSHFSPETPFHQEGGPWHYFKSEVMKGLLHTAAIAFPSNNLLAVFSQDMMGCDRYFAIYEGGKLLEYQRQENVHLNEQFQRYDLYDRCNKFKQNRV